jgi:membrane protease YdiL (CAAX protease family)
VTNPNSSDLGPLSRDQILWIMALTAVVLLIIAKIWLYLGSVSLLKLTFTPPDFAWGIALAAGIVMASSVVYRLWPDYRQSADTYLELVIKPLNWSDLIWLGLLPGLSEELLFRGVMLPALGLNVLALVVSSLVFGVLHLSGEQQWPYVIWATVVGLALGYSALATGNVLVPIVAHVLTNLASSSLWKWRHPREQTSNS